MKDIFSKLSKNDMRRYSVDAKSLAIVILPFGLVALSIPLGLLYHEYTYEARQAAAEARLQVGQAVADCLVSHPALQLRLK